MNSRDEQNISHRIMHSGFIFGDKQIVSLLSFFSGNASDSGSDIGRKKIRKITSDSGSEGGDDIDPGKTHLQTMLSSKM